MKDETKTTQSDETKTSDTDADESVAYGKYANLKGEHNKLQKQYAEMKDKIDTIDSKNETDLQKQGEYKVLYEQTSNKLKTMETEFSDYKSKADQLDSYVTARKAVLDKKIESLPDDKKSFASGMTDLDQLETYLALEAKSKPEISDQERQGKFGGYSSKTEWFRSDPKGYNQAHPKGSIKNIVNQ